MNSIIILFPFLFIVVAFGKDFSFEISSLLASTPRLTCDFVQRYQECSVVDQPVCSTYPGQCLAPSCMPQDFPNSCIACQDPTVSGFTFGTCSEQEQEDESPSPGETENEGSNEETEEGPEEEAQPEEEVPTQPQPVRDSFYVVVYCEDPRPQNCTNEFNPVCVVGCRNGTCLKTVDNVCKACQDPNILSYTLEKCEKEKIYCSENNSSPAYLNSCISLYDPVCAYQKNCTGNRCKKTVTNGCEACVIQKAEYFELGPC